MTGNPGLPPHYRLIALEKVDSTNATHVSRYGQAFVDKYDPADGTDYWVTDIFIPNGVIVPVDDKQAKTNKTRS